jgi:hypothetical protein
MFKSIRKQLLKIEYKYYQKNYTGWKNKVIMKINTFLFRIELKFSK